MWVEGRWSRHWSRECTERKGIAILGSLITQGPKRSSRPRILLTSIISYWTPQGLKCFSLWEEVLVLFFRTAPSAPTCVQTLLISLWKVPTVIPVLLSKPFCPVYIKIFEVLFMHPLGMTFWLGLSCVGICRVWNKALLLTLSVTLLTDTSSGHFRRKFEQRNAMTTCLL